MREFFKYVFATVLGVVISFFLIIIVSILLVVGLVSSIETDKTVTVSKNSFFSIDTIRSHVETQSTPEFGTFALDVIFPKSTFQIYLQGMLKNKGRGIDFIPVVTVTFRTIYSITSLSAVGCYQSSCLNPSIR